MSDHRTVLEGGGRPGATAAASASTADAVLLGVGGAGTAVLHQLALALLRSGGAGEGPRRRPLRVVAVDPLDRLAQRPADRTWCSWVARGGREEAELAGAVHRSWRRVHLVDAAGTDSALDLGPLSYAMVRGEDWYAHVAAAVDEARSRGLLELEHRAVELPAGALVEDAAGVRVTTPAGVVTAGCVLDSRPARPLVPGTSTLVQHFLGERVRTPVASVDPDRAVLMDFTVPQPPVGLAFGYCLPTDASTALVEHTAFVPARLQRQEQEAALAAYRRAVLGDGGVVEHTETGAIPMTDAVFPLRPPPAGMRRSRVLRLGTAGGAVRPSTGYAFSAMQRTARALAPQLVAGAGGGDVELPRPYPRRHAAMDALVLRGLLAGPAAGGLDGPAFFARLFARNPPERVLRFLDGLTGPAEEIALMATAPRGPMLRAAGQHLGHQLGQRAGHR